MFPEDHQPPLRCSPRSALPGQFNRLYKDEPMAASSAVGGGANQLLGSSNIVNNDWSPIESGPGLRPGSSSFALQQVLAVTQCVGHFRLAVAGGFSFGVSGCRGGSIRNRVGRHLIHLYVGYLHCVCCWWRSRLLIGVPEA